MGAKPRAQPQPSAGYSGTPLPRKLGIKDGDRVALIDPPPGFRDRMEHEAPEARFESAIAAETALALWFVFDRATLEARVGALAAATPLRGLWICWRKKAALPNGDVGDAEVRAAGLAHQIVDYKVAAIDETWSGLRFARRKA